MDFSLGAQARIDPQEKHERGKFADLAAKAKEEMEKNRQRDGRKQPRRRGMGQKKGHINESLGGPNTLLRARLRAGMGKKKGHGIHSERFARFASASSIGVRVSTVK